jgi:ABC-2 type transport system permease protein
MISRQLGILMRPRLLSFRHSGPNRSQRAKVALIGTIGLIFWGGIFAVTLRVLTYFQGVEGFGDVLSQKLLSMVLLTFFGLLLFSAILTTLSKLYLSKDLLLIHAMPVPAPTIFLARWTEATLDSAWMVGIYTIPVFISYGMVYDAGPLFYLTIPLSLIPLCLIAAGLSACFVMLSVIVLPASRIRSIFVFLGLAVMIVLYVMFRLLKPERLVDPDSFTTVMLYIQSLQTPSSPWLPTTWMFDALMAALTGSNGGLFFNLIILYSGTSLIVHINQLLAGKVYFPGFSKTQAAAIRLFQRSGRRPRAWLARFPGPLRAFAVKEWKSFWRDQTQWSQLFLLAALVVIYLYNFAALPLDRSPIQTVYLQNLFSFLNMALAAFVLTAVAARFAFPSVSMEGPAFWIVRSAPIGIPAYLRLKWVFYLMPLVVMAELLIVATNLLLQVTPFMMVLSTTTLLFITPGIVSLAVGLGAAYPDFSSENPAQAVTGFGGLLFMILSAAYIGVIIVLQAGPVYAVFMAGIRQTPLSTLQWLWILGSFGLAMGICVTAVVWPLRFGIHRLDLIARGADISEKRLRKGKN